VSSATLPETAAVYWRPRVDAQALARRGRTWTLTTVAHTIPFQGAGGFDFGARITWGLSYAAMGTLPRRDAVDGNSFGLFAGLRL